MKTWKKEVSAKIFLVAVGYTGKKLKSPVSKFFLVYYDPNKHKTSFFFKLMQFSGKPHHFSKKNRPKMSKNTYFSSNMPYKYKNWMQIIVF